MATDHEAARQGPSRDRSFKEELRGTVLICLVLIVSLASGAAASAAVGREKVVLGPGVTLTIGPGWGTPRIGPTGLWSHTWEFADSSLSVMFGDAAPPADLLASYRDDVFANAGLEPRFDAPEPIPHNAGEALLQRWTARGNDGSGYEAELIAVTQGLWGVLLDARWKGDADPRVVSEIRRVMDSLRIEASGP